MVFAGVGTQFRSIRRTTAATEDVLTHVCELSALLRLLCSSLADFLHNVEVSAAVKYFSLAATFN